jgi:hypothetical protein
LARRPFENVPSEKIPPEKKTVQEESEWSGST